MVYVSITGFRVHSAWQQPRFWWLTLRAARQARSAPGNLATSLRSSDGVYHTMTVWSDRAAMLAYLAAGAHREAMRAYHSLGSGKTLGFTAAEAPGWPEALARWRAEA
ncbi:antibiotic biosynthesis monooxygenase, partial [Nostoc sp. NIES-2111]